MSVVVKVSGKLFDEDDYVLIKRLADTISAASRETRVVVVAGGGRLARRYIEAARRAGAGSNYVLDEIGIAVSRLNALLLASVIDGAYPRPATSLGELVEAIAVHRVVAMGGLIPGQSTAAVAVEAAEAVGADLVIDLASVPYVYDKDPSRHRDARPLRRVTTRELLRVMEQGAAPGQYQLIDLHAVMLMERSGIRIVLTSYRRPEAILDILHGRIEGTEIVPA